MWDYNEPEEVLVANSDGGKANTLRVDDFHVDGFRVAGEIHDTIGHEPDEEAASSQYQQQPDDADQRTTEQWVIECLIIRQICMHITVAWCFMVAPRSE